jgi:hypothetical protein
VSSCSASFSADGRSYGLIAGIPRKPRGIVGILAHFRAHIPRSLGFTNAELSPSNLAPSGCQTSFLSFFFHGCCGSDVRLVKKFVGLSPSFPMQSSQSQIIGSHVHRMRHEMNFDNGKLCATRLAFVTFSQQKFLEGNP